MENQESKSFIKSIIRYSVLKLFSFALLVLSSGNLFWIGAWIILGFDIFYFLIVNIIGRKYFPEIVKNRAETKFVHNWDKLAIVIYSICFYTMYIIGGLDFRFSVSENNLILFITGILIYAFGFAITFWVLASNPYATGSARIQKDNNQKVISTGPYKFLRHPMYFTTVLFSISTPLILNSYLAFIPAPFVIAAFIYRCYKEDKMLLDGLEGYKEYSKKVKFRMIPFIW